MISNSIICTLLFTLGLILLIDGSAINSQVDQDGTMLALKKRSIDQNNDLEDEFHGFMLNDHRFAARGVRLPSESILLGKRRLPVEAVLLGRRSARNGDMFMSKRR